MTTRLVLEFALSWIVMLVALSAPGHLWLRWVGFSSDSRADLLVGSVSCSLAYWGLLSLLLGYLGLYFKGAVLVALLAPLVLLGVARRSDRHGFAELSVMRQPAESSPLGLADRAVLAMVFLYLALALVDASTSPYTQWDPLVSWDKWAVDWARRTSVRDYLFGPHGQLLPIVSSISYKLAGSFDETLPIQTFVNHGVQTVFGLVFVVATLRLTRLWALPLWPVLTGLFGLTFFRDYVTSGHADMLLVSLEVVALTLLVGYLKGRWTVQGSVAWVLVPVLAAILLTKASGLLWLGLLILLSLQFRREDPEQFRRVLPRPVKTGVVVVCLAAGCGGFYYGPQYYLDRTFDVRRADPSEHVFTFDAVQTALKTDTEAAARGHSLLGQLGAVKPRVFDAYGLRPKFTRALGLVFLFWAASSLADRRFRVIVPVAIGYSAVFAKVAAYDLRNALPALVLFALSLSGGVATWERIASGRRWLRWAIAALAAVALVLGAFALLSGVGAMATRLLSGPLTVRARIHSLAQPPEARVRLFFAEYVPDLEFLEATAVYPRARHVYIASGLYRFVSHGVYPLKMLDWGLSTRGDVFGGLGVVPSGLARWTQVKAGVHRFWVLDPPEMPVDRAPIVLSGAHPPGLLSRAPGGVEVEFSGSQSVVGWPVSEPPAMSRGSVVWRVTLEKLNDVGPIRAFYGTFIDSRVNAHINQPGTAIVSEPTPAADGSLSYSGILTLEQLRRPLESTDAVLVGIECAARGQRVRIKQFVMSQYPRP
jgi:hypothetical protein